MSTAAAALGASVSAVEGGLKALVMSGEFEEFILEGGRAWRWKPVLRTKVRPGLEEDRIWREVIEPRVADATMPAQKILNYGTTEMLNNVFDHSGANELIVVVRRLPREYEVHIEDDGIGIFAKLQRDKGLEDPQHCALELAKGKLTTDPSRHTGQGIFFTARMCDKFLLWSGTTTCGQTDHGPWIVQEAEHRPGTTVRMAVSKDTTLSLQAVFDEFFPGGPDDSFAKTVLQVSLLQQNGAGLISRSQAKRLLARCDQFREVVLDFTGIESIGPAFADEIFRVFATSHPGVTLLELGATSEVARMIGAARRGGSSA